MHEGRNAFCEDGIYPIGRTAARFVARRGLRPGSRVEPYVPDWIDLRLDLFCIKAPFAGAARGSGNSRSGPERDFSVALHPYRSCQIIAYI